MDHDDSLVLRATRLLDETVEIVGITGQQDGGPGTSQGGRRDHSVNGVAVTRQADCTQKLASHAGQVGRDRLHNDPIEHTMD